MRLSRKLSLLRKIVRWRLGWNKRDNNYAKGKPDDPLFMTPVEAVDLISNGHTVAVSGLGGNQHTTPMYWAIHDAYQEKNEPKDLTVICIGGQGGRGKVPGTVDQLGVKGLCTRFVTGHMETFKNMLHLADQGHVELQCVPQGTLALLCDAQANNEYSVTVPTGLNTVFDPSIGRGTPLAGEAAEQWVERQGNLLTYTMPRIDVALINAPAADTDGNVYMKNTAMLAESREIAKAARNHKGQVIIVVGKIVEPGYDTPYFTPEEVDAIVYHPKTGQTMAHAHSQFNKSITLDCDVPLEEAIGELRWVNQLLGITPRRSDLDRAMARLGASIFAQENHPGVLVNIGTGLPEEVCREIYEGGLLTDITFFTESGVVGGVPGPGVFFGAAAKPDSMVSSAEIFKRAHRELDVTILGILQVDSDGNVNVSKRGEGNINYVGPGGFIDFSTSAKTVIFVGNWMAHGKMAIENGQVKILERGKPKFVESVDEITFSGKQAVEDGRNVFYVTHVGIFRLTGRGLELMMVMPGIDIQADIVDFSPATIHIPEGDVPVVDPTIISGAGYTLSMN
jgi:propionate CoA-transferase